MASRPRASSGSSITHRSSAQSPVGFHSRETLPPISASTYRHPLPQQSQPPSYPLPPRRHPDSPISRTTSISSHSAQLRQPDVESYSRFGSFAAPTPMHSASFSSDIRRSDIPPPGSSDSHSWRDRGSISSSSTRGGVTPSSPALKRKASYFGGGGEEEGRRFGGGDEFETSPSPSKRRRLSGVEGVSSHPPTSSGNIRGEPDRPPPPPPSRGGDDEEEVEAKLPDRPFGKREYVILIADLASISNHFCRR